MRLSPLIATVIALTSIARAESPKPQAPRIKVAIVPGIAVNIDSARVDTLAQDLAEALQSELDVDTAGGLEVRRKLPAEGLPPDCLTTPACVADVAKRLDADQLLFVVMVDSTGSGAVQVDSSWVDTATGTTVARPAIDIPSTAEAHARFIAAAKLLLPDAPVRPKPEDAKPAPIGVMSAEVPRHFTTASYATAGAAVVGLGIGIGFGLATRSKYNACDKPGACEQSQRDAIRNRGIIADTGFVIGIGGLVATSILFATSGKESRLVVAPTTDGVALATVGRF